jgi:chromosome segregation ATPase
VNEEVVLRSCKERRSLFTISISLEIPTTLKMPADASRSTHSSTSGRPKKTKQDKIYELESSLKLAKEENRSLTKNIQKLRGGHPVSSHSSDVDIGGVEKMKSALVALKRVTVNQEKSLKTLRDKSTQRRKELKDKDANIYKLQRQVRSLQKAMNGTGHDQEEKLNEMQKACFEEESRNIELEAHLGQSELQVRRLQKQLEGEGLRRTPSNGSLKSLESTSTAAEFDVAKLKKELADKTDKIVQLEMQLDSLNDDLHEFQQKESAQSAEKAFGSDPFAVRVVADDAFADFQNSCASLDLDDMDFCSDDEEEDADNFW